MSWYSKVVSRLTKFFSFFFQPGLFGYLHVVYSMPNNSNSFVQFDSMLFRLGDHTFRKKRGEIEIDGTRTRDLRRDSRRSNQLSYYPNYLKLDINNK